MISETMIFESTILREYARTNLSYFIVEKIFIYFVLTLRNKIICTHLLHCNFIILET